jgi:hypothetical protein
MWNCKCSGRTIAYERVFYVTSSKCLALSEWTIDRVFVPTKHSIPPQRPTTHQGCQMVYFQNQKLQFG